MAKVPAAVWVSFMVSPVIFRHSGMRLLRRRPGIHNPRSWLWIPGSRLKEVRPGMTAFVSKPPCRLLNSIFRKENLGRVLDDILRSPSLARRFPAVHFHHPHFPYPARAGNAEHLAGLV